MDRQSFVVQRSQQRPPATLHRLHPVQHQPGVRLAEGQAPHLDGHPGQTDRTEAGGNTRSEEEFNFRLEKNIYEYILVFLLLRSSIGDDLHVHFALVKQRAHTHSYARYR